MPSTTYPALPFDGLADLEITHGQAPGLGRKARIEAVKVFVDTRSQSSKVVVDVGRALGVELLLPPKVTHAQVTLPCGHILAGTVIEISPTGNSFVIDTINQSASSSSA